VAIVAPALPKTVPAIPDAIDADPIEAAMAAFNAGDCFFARREAVTPERTRIEIFASDRALMEQFYRTVSNSGSDVVVGGRPVSRAQCAALRTIGRSEARPTLAIELDDDCIGNGGQLTGSVRVPERHALRGVFVIDGDGHEHDLVPLLRPQGEAGHTHRFAAPVSVAGAGAGGRDQAETAIVIAVADSIDAIDMAAADVADVAGDSRGRRPGAGASVASVADLARVLEAAGSGPPPAVALAYFVVHPATTALPSDDDCGA
jgi:hypothetical protein